MQKKYYIFFIRLSSSGEGRVHLNTEVPEGGKVGLKWTGGRVCKKAKRLTSFVDGSFVGVEAWIYERGGIEGAKPLGTPSCFRSFPVCSNAFDSLIRNKMAAQCPLPSISRPPSWEGLGLVPCCARDERRKTKKKRKFNPLYLQIIYCCLV